MRSPAHSARRSSNARRAMRWHALSVASSDAMYARNTTLSVESRDTRMSVATISSNSVNLASVWKNAASCGKSVGSSAWATAGR